MPALLGQGKTALRDTIKNSLVSHVCISDDDTAFSDAHTGINPVTNKSVLVEGSTDSDAGTEAFDASITLTGETEFTDKTIWSIGLAKGTAVMQAAQGTGTLYGAPTVGTDCLSRSVRTQGIGVQDGDNMVLAVRFTVEDNSS